MSALKSNFQTDKLLWENASKLDQSPLFKRVFFRLINNQTPERIWGRSTRCTFFWNIQYELPPYAFPLFYQSGPYIFVRCQVYKEPGNSESGSSIGCGYFWEIQYELPTYTFPLNSANLVLIPVSVRYIKNQSLVASEVADISGIFSTS